MGGWFDREINNFGRSIENTATDIGKGLEDVANDVAALHPFQIANDLVFDPAVDWLMDQIPTPDIPASPSGTLLTKQGGTVSVPVVYGARRLGGQRIFVETTGAKNEYLHLVITLCEGDIDNIGSVWINDEEIPPSSIDANGNVTAGTFSGLLRIKKHLGSDTQAADSDLVAESTRWTTAHQLKGVAYIYLRCKWDQDNRAFGGYPRMQVDVQGRKVYDPRTSTTAFSSNPALCIYDYLTDARYGRGLLAADIDTQSFIDAANYCDEQITPYSGAAATINRYACDGVVDTSRQVLDNIKSLLTTCRGWLPYVAGQWRIVLDKPGTPSFTFDPDNMLGALSFSNQGRRGKLNRVEGSYANPDEKYAADIVVIDEPTFRSEDNGLVLNTRITLPHTTSVYRTKRLCELMLKQSRQTLTAQFSATLDALSVSVGDVVYVTHPTPGWTNKPFRTAEITLRDDATVAVRLTEYEATVYNLTLPTAAPTPPDTNLPNPNVVAPATNLALASGNNELILGGDGSIISRIKVTWTPADDAYVSKYDIEYKKSADAAWLPAAPAIGQAASETYIVGVSDGVAYDVRVRARNTNDATSGWAQVTNHTVLGKTAVPPDVDTLSVTEADDGTRVISWSMASLPVDLAGYELRYSSDTNAAWSAMGKLADGLLTASPYETASLAAGTYKFAIRAFDRFGNGSLNALTTIVTLSTQPTSRSIANLDLYAGTDIAASGGITETVSFQVQNNAAGDAWYKITQAHISGTTSYVGFSLRGRATFGNIQRPAFTQYISFALAVDTPPTAVQYREYQTAFEPNTGYGRFRVFEDVDTNGLTTLSVYVYLGSYSELIAELDVYRTISTSVETLVWQRGNYLGDNTYTPPGTEQTPTHNRGVQDDADVTALNTAADTAAVNGRASASVDADAAAGATLTGSDLVSQGGMLPNWACNIADTDGLPAGIMPIEGVYDRAGLSWYDTSKTQIKLQHATDGNVAYGFPAIPIDDKRQYRIVIRHASASATTTGLYIRMNELATELVQGKTHVGLNTTWPATQTRTSIRELIADGPMPGTAWESTVDLIYTPTPGSRFASLSFYQWTGDPAHWYAVDAAMITLVPLTADRIDETAGRKWAGESGADVTAANTAAAIAGQGALATQSAADYSTQVSGTKPPPDADKTKTALEAVTTITQGGLIVGGTNASVKVGSATDYLTGLGVFAGTSGGIAKFSVGDPANEKYLAFDGQDSVLGRDTELRGADAYNNNTLYVHDQYASLDAMTTSSNASLAAGGLAIYLSGSVGSSGYAQTNKSYALITNSRLGLIDWPTYPNAMRIKSRVVIDSLVSASSDIFIGIGEIGFPIYTDNQEGFGFLISGGTVYGKSADGSSYSLTSAFSGVTIDNTYGNLFEIIYEKSPVRKVYFYVDGVLQGSLTTTMPSIGSHSAIYQILAERTASGTAGYVKSGEYKILMN